MKVLAGGAGTCHPGLDPGSRWLPAKAGNSWIPAFAGMTLKKSGFPHVPYNSSIVLTRPNRYVSAILGVLNTESSSSSPHSFQRRQPMNYPDIQFEPFFSWVN